MPRSYRHSLSQAGSPGRERAMGTAPLRRPGAVGIDDAAGTRGAVGPRPAVGRASRVRPRPQRGGPAVGHVLARSRDLTTVYQFRQKLQDIWQRSTATPEALVQALQEWCRQAEQTGIKALQEFAYTLPGYTRRAT